MAYSQARTRDDVAASLVTPIDGVTANLALTASANSGNSRTVSLIQDTRSSFGGRSIATTVRTQWR